LKRTNAVTPSSVRSSAIPLSRTAWPPTTEAWLANGPADGNPVDEDRLEHRLIPSEPRHHLPTLEQGAFHGVDVSASERALHQTAALEHLDPRRKLSPASVADLLTRSTLTVVVELARVGVIERRVGHRHTAVS
jgi:hypothetical protein